MHGLFLVSMKFMFLGIYKILLFCDSEQIDTVQSCDCNFSLKVQLACTNFDFYFTELF